MKKLYKNNNDWTFDPVFNKDTYEYQNIYFYKGCKCIRYEILSERTKKLSALKLIEKDLRSITSWLEKIQETTKEFTNKKSQKIFQRSSKEDGDLAKALFVASLSLYGRLFTKSKGRITKLNRSWIEQDELKKAHDEIMGYRHNFAAHCGETEAESINIVVVVAPIKYRGTLPEVVSELKQPDFIFFQEDGEDDFLKLVKTLHEKVVKKANQLQANIFLKEVLPKGPEFWFNNCKKTNTPITLTS